MNFLRIFASFLLAGVLIQGSHQDCLTSAQLATLGFTASANATTSTTVCADLYANNGGCVDPAQMQSLFTINENNLHGNANATINLDAALINVSAGLENLASVLAKVAANITATLANATANLTNTLANITSTVANTNVAAGGSVSTTTTAKAGQTTTSTSASANVSINSTLINRLNTIVANSRAATDQCYQNYQNLVNGIYCYLTSNKASANVQASSTGNHTTFTVAIDTNTTGAALSVCLPLIDSYCTLTYGISISTDVTNSYLAASTYSGASGNTNIAASSCTLIRNNYNCTTSTCQTAIYNELINNVFNPARVNFIQSSTYLNAQTTYFGALGNSTTNITSFFKRRLQYAGNGSNSTNSTSGSVTPASSSNGENVSNHGQKSGASSTSYASSSAQLLAALSAFVFALIYA